MGERLIIYRELAMIVRNNMINGWKNTSDIMLTGYAKNVNQMFLRTHTLFMKLTTKVIGISLLPLLRSVRVRRINRGLVALRVGLEPVVRSQVHAVALQRHQLRVDAVADLARRVVGPALEQLEGVLVGDVVFDVLVDH